MEADLVSKSKGSNTKVGESIETAAFLYGMMTLFDKSLNGVVAQVASPFAEEKTAIRLIMLLLPGTTCTYSINFKLLEQLLEVL